MIRCQQKKLYDNSRLFQKKDELVSIFKGITLYRRGELWFFERKNSKIADMLIVFAVEGGNIYFRKIFLKSDTNALKQEIAKMMEVMKTKGIVSVSSKEDNLGITLQFYLPNDQKLLYIEDLTKIKNQEWKNYLGKASKVDSNWFLVDIIPR
jgi:hypothetical protein